MTGREIVTILFAACLLWLAACDDHDHAPTSAPGHDHDDAAHANRAGGHIEVPEAVRRNLGITFSKVELRPVAQTLRVPGRFELQPQARREYRTMLAGRVELLVKQFDRVTPGMPLYRLASSEWRELQQKLNEAMAVIRQTEARVANIPSLLEAHRNHEDILREGVRLWEKRLKQIEESEAGGAISIDEMTAIQNTLATKKAELAEVLEKEAELQAQSASAQAEHDAAHARFRLLLATASTLIHMDARDLSAPYDLDEHLHIGETGHAPDEYATSQPSPLWRDIDEIEVSAAVAGVVDLVGLTTGAWASEGSLVVSTIDPRDLRFRATAMQSDIGRLRDGLPSQIVPPKGGTLSQQDSMEAALSLGLVADSTERTIELVAVPGALASWARPGMSGFLEIVTAGGTPEPAIPLSSVVQDGLQRYFFRRAADDPDEVERVEADLGVDDGRWVVVKSGVKEGDEIVLDGVYQLMMGSEGGPEKGGHFHADGTFHADEDH